MASSYKTGRIHWDSSGFLINFTSMLRKRIRYSSFIVNVWFMFLCAFHSIGLRGEEYADTVGIVHDARNITITKEGYKIKVYSDYIGNDKKESFFYFSKENKKNTEDTFSISQPNSATPEIIYPFSSFTSMSNDDVYTSRPSNKGKDFILLGDDIYWGWRFNYFDKCEIANGFEVGIGSLIGMGWRLGRFGTEISIGAGVGMKRFLTSSGHYYNVVNNSLIIEPPVDSYYDVSSTLFLYTIHLPFNIRQNVGKACTFSFGWTFDFNIYATAAVAYNENNSSYKINFKGLQQRFLTGHLKAAFTIYGIGLYGAWEPIALFRGQYGPMLKGWSIGITIQAK